MAHADPVPGVASLRHWRLDVDASGIAWLCFDRQDAGANTLSTDTMTELHAVLAGLSRGTAKGLVIHSAKPSGFIAGAEIPSGSLPGATGARGSTGLDKVRR